MALFVLDASVAISWCFPGDPTENTPDSRGILNRLAVDDAIVPEIWAFEIANSIFVSYSKRKRITEQQVREYLDLLKALPIRVEAQGLWANVDWNLSLGAGTSRLKTPPICVWRSTRTLPWPPRTVR